MCGCVRIACVFGVVEILLEISLSNYRLCKFIQRRRCVHTLTTVDAH